MHSQVIDSMQSTREFLLGQVDSIHDTLAARIDEEEAAARLSNESSDRFVFATQISWATGVVLCA